MTQDFGPGYAMWQQIRQERAARRAGRVAGDRTTTAQVELALPAPATPEAPAAAPPPAPAKVPARRGRPPGPSRKTLAARLAAAAPVEVNVRRSTAPQFTDVAVTSPAPPSTNGSVPAVATRHVGDLASEDHKARLEVEPQGMTKPSRALLLGSVRRARGR